MQTYYWPEGWMIKNLPFCGCYTLEPRVDEDEKLTGNWIFNKLEYSGVVVVVVVVVVVCGVEHKIDK